jgi:hypothetical protein
MKVDAYEHVTALDMAVAKTKLFSIGMSSSTTSAFPIKYVIQKCFTVDTTTISMLVPDAQVILFYIIYCTNNIPHQNYRFHEKNSSTKSGNCRNGQQTIKQVKSAILFFANLYQLIFICLHVTSMSIHMTAHKQKEH